MLNDKTFYFRDQIRQCEQYAINDLNISEEILMQRAGRAAFNILIQQFPKLKVIAVFCGGGKNAGDAYILARLAREYGLTVFVHQYKTLEELPTLVREAAMEALAAGVICQTFDDGIDNGVELVIDGLLGTGLEGEVREPFTSIITLLNESGLPIFSLDLPSGLDADTGRVLGVCIKAKLTVTFIAPKFGMYTAAGPDVCGQIVCHDLQIKESLAHVIPAAFALDKSLLQNLSPRPKNCHKGMFGHVLVIGGNIGMPGAAYLAALAALKSGAGMISIATRPEHVCGALPLLPEAMIYPVETADDVLPLLEKATVCILGPGLGDNRWAKDLFSAAVTAPMPLVIDASALHFLAKHPQEDDNWILTPHPGEAAILLSCTVKDVMDNRYAAARLIQQRYGGCVVLKGTGTIIHNGEKTAGLCIDGNPGMATAGMGDILSGIIGGLLAQGVELGKAAQLGTWLHASAADDAALAFGERGFLASEVMPFLRQKLRTA